jgi:flagellar biosynthesis/type III secretory pathway chaperone
MDKDLLNSVILKEHSALKNLLLLLEKQHELILKNDIFALEAIVEEIQNCNKEVAQIEVERRSLVKGNSMTALVESFNDEEIDNSFRSVKMLLSELQLQKDTNEMLIKQGLSFSTKILNIINPNKNVKTYNAYGKLGK